MSAEAVVWSTIMVFSLIFFIIPSLLSITDTKSSSLPTQINTIWASDDALPGVDFDTPENIRKAANKAIESGETRYVPGKGTPLLQNAIQKKFFPDENLPTRTAVGVSSLPKNVCVEIQSIFELKKDI